MKSTLRVVTRANSVELGSAWPLTGHGYSRRYHCCLWSTCGQLRKCDIHLKREDSSMKAPDMAAVTRGQRAGPAPHPRLRLRLDLVRT